MNKVISILCTAALVLSILFTGNSVAEEKATPEEIIKKTREAAAFLSQAGDAGLAEFNDKAGRWVWKDTYIFVYNCEKGTIAAHPIKPNLIGKNLMGLKDIKGNFFYVQLCDAAKKEKGDWTEYWWPKPEERDPSRKVSLMLQVLNTPYQVGSGIYDDHITIDELRALTK